mgnify:CR=1 FL=1
MLNIERVFLLINGDHFCHHKDFGFVIFDFGPTPRVEDVFQCEVRDAERLSDAGKLAHIVESGEMQPGDLGIFPADTFEREGVEFGDVAVGLIVADKTDLGVLGAPFPAVNEGARRLRERTPLSDGHGNGGWDGARSVHKEYGILTRGVALSVT